MDTKEYTDKVKEVFNLYALEDIDGRYREIKKKYLHRIKEFIKSYGDDEGWAKIIKLDKVRNRFPTCYYNFDNTKIEVIQYIGVGDENSDYPDELIYSTDNITWDNIIYDDVIEFDRIYLALKNYTKK